MTLTVPPWLSSGWKNRCACWRTHRIWECLRQSLVFEHTQFPIQDTVLTTEQFAKKFEYSAGTGKDSSPVFQINVLE
jgi:hypothetical protein